MPNDDFVGVPQDYRVARGRVRVPRQPPTPLAPNPEYRLSPRTTGPHMETVYSRPLYTQNWLESWWSAPPRRVGDLQMWLYQNKYLTSVKRIGTFDETTYNAIKSAVSEANHKGIDLQTMAEQQRLNEQAMASAGYTTSSSSSSGGGGGGGGGTMTYTTSTTTVSSRSQAQALLTNALTQELGRAPTPAEVNDFLKALNTEQAKHPVVQTSVVSGSGSSQKSKVSTKDQSIDPSTYSTDYAKKNMAAERTKFQDSQYMDVISKMLGM